MSFTTTIHDLQADARGVNRLHAKANAAVFTDFLNRHDQGSFHVDAAAVPGFAG